MTTTITVTAADPEHRSAGASRRRAAGMALGASGFIFFLAEFVAASAWTDPPYSYTYHYISDLGVHGPSTAFDQYMYSPLAVVMNAGFFLFGIAALAGVVMLPGLPSGRRWSMTLMAVLLAAGGVLVALFPGSAEAIDNGTVMYHGLGAFALFIGGNVLAVLLGAAHPYFGLSRKRGRGSVVLGVLGLISLGAFGVVLAAGTGNFIGFFERGAVYLFLICFIRTGLALTKREIPALDEQSTRN
jgi:hypothetical membrane protein